jgi:hypothetical protein
LDIPENKRNAVGGEGIVNIFKWASSHVVKLGTERGQFGTRPTAVTVQHLTGMFRGQRFPVHLPGSLHSTSTFLRRSGGAVSTSTWARM